LQRIGVTALTRVAHMRSLPRKAGDVVLSLGVSPPVPNGADALDGRASWRRTPK
jgi:hypothetical protein